jgi:hypothetical protein
MGRLRNHNSWRETLRLIFAALAASAVCATAFTSQAQEQGEDHTEAEEGQQDAVTAEGGASEGAAPDDGASEEVDEPESGADPELDDWELDDQTYEGDDDIFVPTEEIPADEPIPFPSDI